MAKHTSKKKVTLSLPIPLSEPLSIVSQAEQRFSHNLWLDASKDADEYLKHIRNYASTVANPDTKLWLLDALDNVHLRLATAIRDSKASEYLV